MSTAHDLRGPYLGVSAVVVRGDLVLVGRRRGSHGAGDLGAFPGGKVDPGEDPAETARRELLEETGLGAITIEPLAWTSDVLPEGGLHFVTLHHRVLADDGEPRVIEPDKVHQWIWVAWDRIPEPRFAPAASLLATGWRP